MGENQASFLGKKKFHLSSLFDILEGLQLIYYLLIYHVSFAICDNFKALQLLMIT